MTERVAHILAGAFTRGCADIANSLGAIAVALRPSMQADGCTHPDELRDHAGATMGHPRWTCTGCGFEFDAKGGK
jgi:hypothetical protein